MKIYDATLNGYEGEVFAREYARGLDWQDVEISEENRPQYSTYIDTVNGVEIYYNYGADYYFFADSTN